MHEASSNPLSLADGSFRVNSSASALPVTLAGDWLVAISQANAPNHYEALRLHSPTAQDFVLFHQVPEPGAIQLAALAMAGLVASRLRSRRH